MEAVKRIEIVTDAFILPSLLHSIDECGATGYTVIHEVTGKGGRGERHDDMSDVFRNCYILIACDPEVAARIVDVVRPILKRNGGVCLISDAQYIKH